MNHLQCIVSMPYLILLLSRLILSPRNNKKKTHISNLQRVKRLNSQYLFEKIITMVEIDPDFIQPQSTDQS